MSVLWKMAQGFCALGGVGVTPLFWVNPFEKPRYFDAPPAQVSETLEQLEQAGYKDCSPLTGYRGLGTLYVCWYWNTDGSLVPSLFHFNRSRTIRGLAPLKRVNQFVSKEMKFVDGTSESLTFAPFWMSKWQGSEFISEKHCTKPTKLIWTSRTINKLTCINPQDKQEVQIY